MAIPPNPYMPRVEYSDQWWTTKVNPKDHTFGTAGRWYSIGTAEDVTRTFPDGLAGDIVEDFIVTNSSAMVVRPIGVSLVQNMEHWRQTTARAISGGKGGSKAVLDVDTSKPYNPPTLDAPIPRAELFAGKKASKKAAADAASLLATEPLKAAAEPARVLTGPKGIGKSAVLNYVVHYARSNEWIVLFVPHTFDIMRMGKVLVPSKRRTHASGAPMIDQHDTAVRILKEFQRTAEPLLKKVPQRRKYASFRYLPQSIDVTVSAQRETLRASEETEKARLKAQAEAAGKTWDPASFVSK